MLVRQRRLFSRLSLQILAVNMIPVILLGFGLLYINAYQNNLVRAELRQIERQAGLFAGAIAETANNPSFSRRSEMLERFGATGRIIREDLPHRQARRMLRRIAETTDMRIRVFNRNGQIIGDTDRLTGAGGMVKEMPLDTQNRKTIGDWVEFALAAILNHIPSHKPLKPYPDIGAQEDALYPDVTTALTGVKASNAWSEPHDSQAILLSSAVPIQRLKQVLGVVYVTQDGTDIAASMRKIKMDVMKVFLIVLILTSVLSLYLSARIARPLNKLSDSARRMQRDFGHGVEIPDFSRRNDEIGDLSIALRSMTHSLEERLDSIERFAADVAHEIKNPLTSLRSAVETASIVKGEDDRQRLMEIILHDVERLDRLISDISNASRLDAELSREEMGVVDMRSLLVQLVDSLKDPMQRIDKNKKSKFTLSFPQDAGDILVRGINTRLGQVFQNLISNALSFSPDDAPIRIAAIRQDRHHWAFTVSDSGPGIPDAKLSSVFERFYTERPGAENFGAHSGLGLSISKQIIDVHRGRLYAENIYNENGEKSGARFTVILSALNE